MDADVIALATALGQVDAAHRRLRTRVAHQLGVTVTDLIALLVVADAEETTPTHLAAELGLTTGSVTTVIDRLVMAGQVRRAPRAGDRRSILVELTTGGHHTVQIVSGLYLGAIAIALESSPRAVSAQILDSLRHTAAALDGAAEMAHDRDTRLLA
jgi:DNA-binding MarR family transcriptional regulator